VTRLVISAWLVHLYTASGALCAFLALNRIFYDRYRDAFVWLGVAVVIDATDGMLARRADVATRIPWFNGRKLDDIVDYLTYVFVPSVATRSTRMPERASCHAASLPARPPPTTVTRFALMTACQRAAAPTPASSP